MRVRYTLIGISLIIFLSGSMFSVWWSFSIGNYSVLLTSFIVSSSLVIGCLLILEEYVFYRKRKSMIRKLQMGSKTSFLGDRQLQSIETNSHINRIRGLVVILIGLFVPMIVLILLYHYETIESIKSLKSLSFIYASYMINLDCAIGVIIVSVFAYMSGNLWSIPGILSISYEQISFIFPKIPIVIIKWANVSLIHVIDGIEFDPEKDERISPRIGSWKSQKQKTLKFTFFGRNFDETVVMDDKKGFSDDLRKKIDQMMMKWSSMKNKDYIKKTI